jgi:hypothetical protein
MKKTTLYLLAGYVLALVLGFIGAPKQSLVVYAIAFLIFSGCYWLAVYYVKKIHSLGK